MGPAYGGPATAPRGGPIAILAIAAAFCGRGSLFFAEGAGRGRGSLFEALGTQIADILLEVGLPGLPDCKGGVMAKNAPWRGSAKTWRDRVASWITRSKPEDLLCVDIFFDLRGVHGDTALANGLRAHAFDLAKGQMPFLKLLVESAGAVEPGLNFFRGFRTDKGRIELKRLGLFGIVTAAQALAIRSRERSHGADRSIQPLRGRFHGRAERISRNRHHAELTPSAPAPGGG